MEDFADYFASEATTENAAVHEFISSYTGEDEVHVFLEGEEDFIFYLPEVRRHAAGRQVFSYNCGGKWSVIEAKATIYGNYDVLCLFFVDRDFDDFLGRQPQADAALYITDFYSIENHVTGDMAAEVLFREVLALSRHEADNAKASFEAAHSAITSRIVALGAWIVAAKESGCNPNLNNTNSLNGLVKVTPDGRLFFDTEGFLVFKRRVDSGAGTPPTSLFLSWYRRVRGVEFDLICRGKYRAWLFCKAAQIVVSSLNTERRAQKRRQLRLPDSIGGCRAVELLAGRVPYPRSLSEFLTNAL